MKPRVERIWPPRILGLTGRGLAVGWPAVLGAFLAMAAISIGKSFLPPITRLGDNGMTGYLLHAGTDIITDGLIGSVLVSWLIHWLDPNALGGARPTSRMPAGWGASSLVSLVIRGPSTIGIAVGTAAPDLYGPVYLAGLVLALTATVFLGYSLGEAVTRNLNPLQAMAGSIKVTRGNRFALLVATLIIQTIYALANFGVAKAAADLPTLPKLHVILAGQAAFGVLGLVAGTAIYLELRRVQLAARPEAISETFD